MKTIAYIFAAVLLLTSCSNEQEKDSEIIQHKEISEVILDGPAQPMEVKTKSIAIEKTPNEADAALQVAKKRRINEAPSRSMEELKMEVTLLEEQGKEQANAAQTYYDYGNAMVETKDYEGALEAYKKAEELGYSDMKNLCFKIGKTYALTGDYYGSMEDYLMRAVEHGFRNYRALLYGEAFKEFRTEYEFMYLYQELFGDKQKAMFKAFVTFAPKKNLIEPYVLNPVTLFENTDYDHRDEVDYYKKHPRISGYFEGFVEGVSDGMFSRGGGDNYRYEMLLANNKNYTAVIYSKEEEWAEYLLPKEYRLITYDKTGNKISELEIAKRGSMKTCKGVVFHPDHTLEVTNYKIAWKKGVKSKVEKDDKHLMHEHLDFAKAEVTKTYKINSTGRISETEGVLLGMR